jgi:hypothetical protein
MMVEMAGFMFGMAAIGVALLLLHRRQTSRIMSAIYAGSGTGQRG